VQPSKEEEPHSGLFFHPKQRDERISGEVTQHRLKRKRGKSNGQGAPNAMHPKPPASIYLTPVSTAVKSELQNKYKQLLNKQNPSVPLADFISFYLPSYFYLFYILTLYFNTVRNSIYPISIQSKIPHFRVSDTKTHPFLYVIIPLLIPT
jgi:hypothetical protein